MFVSVVVLQTLFAVWSATAPVVFCPKTDVMNVVFSVERPNVRHVRVVNPVNGHYSRENVCELRRLAHEVRSDVPATVVEEGLGVGHDSVRVNQRNLEVGGRVGAFEVVSVLD